MIITSVRQERMLSAKCLLIQILSIAITFLSFENTVCFEENTDGILSPTIFMVILARNKAHTVPHFLGYLERLQYPKSRISLWIRSDHNIDNTADILRTWLDVHRKEYHAVDVLIDDSSEYFSDENGIFDWSPQHFNHVINLKEKAFRAAKKMWADYVWFLDSDVFIVNNNTINLLLQEQKAVIAPLMESLGAYSNFWCGMTDQGYYKRTEDYLPILEQEKLGCFNVPMIHSAVLVDLRRNKSQNLTFDPKKIQGYSGPNDDIIAFAHSSKFLGVDMFILNTEQFGFMLAPLEKGYHLQDDRAQLTNLKIDVMVEGPPMYIPSELRHFVPVVEKDKLGLDEIYLINLKRRPLRLKRMLLSLEELGVKPFLIDAVDGVTLNDSKIEEMGIKMLPEYSDPYHKRPLTKGEIGCFLSHYAIWKDMIAKQHRTALVFEDDLRFETFFKRKLLSLLKEAQKLGMLWDLIYLGRKRLSDANEPYVEGSTSFVHVDYSYWTLCYLITLEGAKKLVGARPLSKMVPVDEYLPIMFDRHPQAKWKDYYTSRNLKAFSAHPLLVYPTHYTGELHYISDTEDSDVLFTTSRKEEL